MKPIKLEIEGINSFANKQVIDFEELTKKGLFGIFGKTGSGKSTILDAITLALYGNIARGSKEFINTGMDKGTVDYEFELGLGNNKKRYRVSRRFKRNKKSGTSVSDYVRLTELSASNEVVIADKVKEVNDSIKSIIGLEEDDFLRSVVLPQGKFSEFLKINGKDRRNMLERIFNLEEYGTDLTAKLSAKKKALSMQAEILDAKLKEYPNVSEEAVKDLEEKREELLKAGKLVSENFNKKQEEFKKQEEIFKLCEERKKQEEIKVQLDKEKTEVQKIENKLELAKKADTVVPEVEKLEKLNIENSRLEKEENKAGIDKKNIEGKKENLEVEFEKISEKYEDLAELAIIDNKIENILKLAEKVRVDKAKIEENQKEYKILEESLKQSTEKKTNLEKEIKNLETETVETDNAMKRVMLDLTYKGVVNKGVQIFREAHGKKAIYQRDEKARVKLEEEIKELENKLFAKNDVLGKKEEEIGGLIKLISEQQIIEVLSDDEFEKISNRISHSEKSIKSLNEKNKLVEEMDEKIKGLEKDLEILNQELEILKKKEDEQNIQILTQKVREHWKHSFKAGDNCPLCGSTVEKLDFESKAEEVYSEHKEELEEKEKAREVLKSEYTSLKAKKEVTLEEIEKINKTFENITDPSIENIQNRLEELKEYRDNQRGLKKSKQDNLEELRKQKDEINSEKQNFFNEVKVLESQIKDKKNLVKEQVEKMDKDKLEIEDLDNELEEIKTKYKIEDIEAEEVLVNEKEKERERLQTIANTLKEREKQQQESLAAINGILSDVNTNKTVLEKDIERLKNSVEGNSEEGKTILESLDLEDICKKLGIETKKLNDIKDEIGSYSTKIKTEYKKLKESLEEIKKEAKQIIETFETISRNLAISKNNISQQEELISTRLESTGFKDFEEARLAFVEELAQGRMVKEIEEYTSARSENNIRLKDIEDKLGNKVVEKEELISLKEEIENIARELDEKRKEYGKVNSLVETMQENLKTVVKIKKEEKENKKKLDTAMSLEKVLKGNKFVEYLSRMYLDNIVRDASQRLSEITNSRYTIEIDEDYAFIVRDGNNGGQRRAADTLSGGEIFLTSLSLALALSSQIQLKGSAPLEFFFLDEGFGTLDDGLLDMVIDSLERLQSDTMSVGIISHVEALKERVPMRLLVKMGETGSKAEIKEL